MAIRTVVLDLFGTLVAAPTQEDRASAAERLAGHVGCGASVIDDYFRGSWSARHDGTLSTVQDLATHLVRAAGGSDTAIKPTAEELVALGRARLVPDTSVVRMLRSLRAMGLRVGVLSDASAEIATAWPMSALAACVDAALFSCQAGVTKPHQSLYFRLIVSLGARAQQTLYVGDGGGDELCGAIACGLTAVAVHRRGPVDALAFGHTEWAGPVLSSVEDIPLYIAEQK